MTNKKTSNESYNVGGVSFPQPFKIRRLGHVGFHMEGIDAGKEFYCDVLGFRTSDELDFSNFPDPDVQANVKRLIPDPRAIFASHNTDHHTFVITPKGVMEAFNIPNPDEIRLNQIAWQVGSIEEITQAVEFFNAKGVKVDRVGRDFPGSNWHVYFQDPDQNAVELFYGIEQVGWNGTAKPMAMYGLDEPAQLPMPGELAEIKDALDKGVDIHSGNRQSAFLPATYDVGGVLQPRPFRITNMGPVVLFCRDMKASEAFYKELLGFVECESVTYSGHRCIFLRNSNEHHSLALFPVELREELGLHSGSLCASVGMQVGSYQQLRSAVTFFQEKGSKIIDFPQELHPGIDYAVHLLDPEGNCIQLYYHMEQVGWDGKPRPPELRRKVSKDWPETIDALSDTYAGQPFNGPIG
ncbi:MAG: VOC family protein [Paraglaciecola sp.]|uniref:VOC family protein n=1 Tax=Paraglaciecola sp. TaxID=1920173 RepID=UPI00329946E1